jgi:hypothetical protein
MITRYTEFLAENVQRSKAIIAQRMKDYESLKDRLTRDNTLGYLGKLTELLFRDEPVSDIMAAYDRLMTLRRANVRLDIESVRTLEQLQDLLETKEIDLQVAQVMSKFPPAQRRLFHPVTMTKQDRVLLANMSKVDTAPFMRKVSQYRDKATLVDNAKRFMKSVSTPADKEHFKGLAGGGLSLVHEDDRLLIFRTDTVADLLKVAADAAWCIKNPGTFKKYTSNGATQFVLIDYDKGRWDPMFKIGFTVATNGTITHAHDVLDKSVIPQVRELLAAQAVSVRTLIGDSSDRPGRAKLPRKDAAMSTIYKWVDENGALPDEARELLRMVSDKITPRDLETYSIRSMLGKLLTAVSPERMVPAKDLAGLLPGPVVSAIKRDYQSFFSDYVLFDLREYKIADLTNTRLLPHLDAITHDVFNGVSLADAVKYVSRMVSSQETRMAKPDIAECVRRLVSLHDTAGNKERAQLLMAAVDHAETGRPPEYNTIDPLLKDLRIDGNNRIDILVELGVRIPFNETEVLRAMRFSVQDQYMSLVDFGRRVTLKQVLPTFTEHRRLFSKLIGAGIDVAVETNEKSVTQVLEYYAVWTTATGQYRQSSNDGMTEWLLDPQLRRVIIRPRSRTQGRFAFAPGTEFPVTYSLPGRYTVTIKKGND